MMNKCYLLRAKIIRKSTNESTEKESIVRARDEEAAWDAFDRQADDRKEVVLERIIAIGVPIEGEPEVLFSAYDP